MTWASYACASYKVLPILFSNVSWKAEGVGKMFPLMVMDASAGAKAEGLI